MIAARIMRRSVLASKTRWNHGAKQIVLKALSGSYSDPTSDMIHIRFFSATPPPPPPEKDRKEESGNIVTSTLRSVMTPQNQFYALVAGGAIGTYAITRIFLGVTSFFTHLNPSVVAKWGFYTGFSCATSEYQQCLSLRSMENGSQPVFLICLSATSTFNILFACKCKWWEDWP